jgi:hypothetical protein
MGQAEMASRASMFVAALSGALVAIAFIAQATGFRRESLLFALLLLPVVLFVGLTTFIRTTDLIAEDVRWVAALDRVRHAYTELAPAAASYFSTGHRDDGSHIFATLNPAGHTSSPVYGLVVTPGVVAVIDAVLAGAAAGVVASLGGLEVAAILVVATVAFIVVLALQAIYGERVYGRSIRGDAGVGRTSEHDPPSR